VTLTLSVLKSKVKNVYLTHTCVKTVRNLADVLMLCLRKWKLLSCMFHNQGCCPIILTLNGNCIVLIIVGLVFVNVLVAL